MFKTGWAYQSGAPNCASQLNLQILEKHEKLGRQRQWNLRHNLAVFASITMWQNKLECLSIFDVKARVCIVFTKLF